MQRVVPNSSSLVFTSEGAEEKTKAINTAALVDVSDLIMHAGFTPFSLANIPIAVALDNYREMIGVEPTMTGCLNTVNLTATRSTTDFSNVNMQVTIPNNDEIADFQFDDEENDVCDMFGDDDDDGGFETVNIRRSSIIASPKRDQAKLLATTPSKGSDPIYDALGDDDDVDEVESLPAAPENTATIMIPSAAAAGNEYSYFDANSLGGCNWAGARHWKRGLRSAIAKTVEVTEAQKDKVDSPTEEVAKERPEPKAKGAAKMPVRIDFSQGAVDVTSLLPPKGKRGGDSTCQTAGAVEKAMIAARGGSLLLPHDAKFTAKDLCRLFLRPRLIVPPNDLKEHLQPALMRHNVDGQHKVDSLQSSSVSNSLYGEKDFVWGSFAADVLTFNANQNEPLFKRTHVPEDDLGGFDDEDNGLYEGFGEDDDNEAGVSTHVDEVAGQMQGLTINNKNLIQAKRVVEKLDIGYG